MSAKSLEQFHSDYVDSLREFDTAVGELKREASAAASGLRARDLAAAAIAVSRAAFALWTAARDKARFLEAELEGRSVRGGVR